MVASLWGDLHVNKGFTGFVKTLFEGETVDPAAKAEFIAKHLRTA
jgi:hypothetical protein